MKAIEDKVKANDDEKHSDWETYQKPVYKTQVVELNKTIKETQSALDKEYRKKKFFSSFFSSFFH